MQFMYKSRVGLSNILFVIRRAYSSIIELFAHWKSGNFNIYIWAWFGDFYSAKKGKSGSIYTRQKKETHHYDFPIEIFF